MPQPTHFKTPDGQNIPLPVFFPDATRAVLKSLDTVDLKNTHTLGILINTFHLNTIPGKDLLKKNGGIKKFMNWDGATISDSGGFQVGSIAKSGGNKNAVTNDGVRFPDPSGKNKKKILFTPQTSLEMQLAIGADMMVVLDDFTPPEASKKEAEISVERTILWAQESKKIFTKYFDQKKVDPKKRP